MDEATWVTCANVEEMFTILPRHANKRKLRLFACACIRDGACHRPDVAGALPRLEKRYALRPTRQQHGRSLQQLHQLPAGVQQVGFILDGPLQHSRRFLQIGLGHRGPAVLVEAVPFGIDHHRFAQLPGAPDDRFGQLGRDHAFGIIRQHAHNHFRQLPYGQARQLGHQPGSERPAFLSVDADDLLVCGRSGAS
jgi:hypothetical protein